MHFVRKTFTKQRMSGNDRDSITTPSGVEDSMVNQYFENKLKINYSNDIPSKAGTRYFTRSEYSKMLFLYI